MFRNHPRGLAPLFFTEMWERFSFYIMLALLTLYMEAPPEQGGLGFSVQWSSQIYGLYIGLIYFTPFFGGMLADRVWGYARTIVAGGIAMMAGHLALAGEGLAFFFAGLLLLIIGNGLFKPNISTILGNLYRDRQDQKDQGYNIFYMGINVGALAAPLTATFLNIHYGWHAAFSCASVGMLLSLVIFWACRHMLSQGEMPARPEGDSAMQEEVPAPVRRLRVQALLIIFGVVVFFWMAFKQNGLTLIRWARDHTEPLDTPLFYLDFSQAASITKSINPFLVITLTPLLVLLWASLKNSGRELSTPRKMFIGMLLTALSCAVMGLAGLAGGNEGRVTVLWLIGGYFFITLAELCISPMGLSVVSKLAPPRSAGVWMGGWFVATSVGNYLAGFLGIFWNTLSHSDFFFVLVGTSLAAAGLLVISMPRLEAAMASLKTPQPEVKPAEDEILVGSS